MSCCLILYEVIPQEIIPQDPQADIPQETYCRRLSYRTLLWRVGFKKWEEAGLLPTASRL